MGFTRSPAPSIPPVWRLLPIVLAGAFAARVAVVLSGDFIYHPDVVFQYLEPAWRLLTGDGLIVWEQFYGARSQLIPATLALAMLALQAIGFDHPTTLRTALEVVLCAVSLLIPWGMYAFARTAFDERTGRAALLLGATWYELVVLAGQPLSELLALPPLLWAFALAADVRSASRARALGLLVCAACATRYQYAPLALWPLALAWPRMAGPWRRHLVGTLLAGAAAVGLFDLLTVGTPPYRSYLANIAYGTHFSEEVVTLGNKATWYFHSVALLFLSGGLTIAAITAGLLRDWQDARFRCMLWLGVPVAVVLIAHGALPWNEYRFVLAVVPLWLILLATVIGVRSFREILRNRIAVAMAVAIMVAWYAATGALGVWGKLPLQAVLHGEPARTVPLRFIGASDPRLSFATSLASDKSFAGLAQIGFGPSTGIGTVHLGRSVPIYDQHTIDRLRRCGQFPLDYATHAIVPPDRPLPRGFAATKTNAFGWRLAKHQGAGADSPQQHPLGPVWAGDVLGRFARSLFEGNPETDSWIVKAWSSYVSKQDGTFPLGRFHVHGPGPRKAPESRLERSSSCPEPLIQQK